MLPEPTEPELLKIVRITACQLARVVGIPADDLEADAWLQVANLMTKWDRQRPVADYLFIALKNKALNDNRRRVGRPKAERPTDPDRAKAWDANRRRRRLIHGPASQTIRRPEGDEPDGRERVGRTDHVGEVDAADYADWLESNLPTHLRPDFRRLLAGETLPFPILKEIRELLG